MYRLTVFYSWRAAWESRINRSKCSAPLAPGRAQKHFHTASPEGGGGVKVLLRYFLTRK